MYVPEGLQRLNALDCRPQDVLEIPDLRARPINARIIKKLEVDPARQGCPKIRERRLVAENARQEEDFRAHEAIVTRPEHSAQQAAALLWRRART